MRTNGEAKASPRKKAIKRKRIVVRDSLESSGHYLVLNTSNGDSYEINATGKLILDCCDGSLTKDEIAKKIADTYRPKEKVLNIDVIRYLNLLLKKGILDEEE
ncbi:MAG TPA: PqqD family protein [Candidatus Bathyarchaeia archaeon]|nr:PqqD family protein [Candidatus Bathyarchaeia archaeon]